MVNGCQNNDLNELYLYFSTGKDLSSYVWENYNFFDLWNAVENGATPPERDPCNSSYIASVRSCTLAVLGNFTTIGDFVGFNRDFYYLYLKAIGSEDPSPTFTNECIGALYDVFTVSSLDTDYQTYLDRGTTLGYTLPSESQKNLQNQLVLDLKSAGAWTLLDGFFIWAQDGDSDMATINLVNPANYQLTKVNSITFTTNLGFKGNGSNMYLNTNYNPVTEAGNYSSNNACIGGWIYQPYSIGDRIAGHITSGNTRLLNRNLSAHRINSGSTNADLTGTGLIYANKTSSSNVTLVKNLITTAVSTSDLTMPGEVLTFFLSQGSLYGDMGMSFGFYGASLAGINTDFYNALNDYLNAI